MKRLIVSLAIAISLSATPAAAQAFAQSLDGEQARRAGENGDIIKYKEIRKKLKNRYGGKLIDLDLIQRPRGGLEYRIQWETKNGERIFLVVDAQTGDIREV